MKIAKNNEISEILEKMYAKSSVEKPVSILFVSEMDDDVRDEILSWCSKHKTYEGLPGHYYEVSDKGFPVKTNDYGFDSSIEGHDVVYQRYEVGYGNDITFKNDEVDTFKNLISKKGLVVDKDLRLAVYSVLTPLWNNNKPIFGPDEYELFDEVVMLELDNDVFKESFIKYYNEIINNIINSNNEEKEEHLNVYKFQKEVGLYILNHPDFRFIPISLTEEIDRTLGDYISNHFTPVNFYQFLTLIDEPKDIMEHISNSDYNLTNDARKMLRKIFEGSKYCE